MPLCFEDGRAYLCPVGGHLLALIENDEGLIYVSFASEIPDQNHDHHGVHKLWYRTPEGQFTKDGIVVYMAKDPNERPPEQASIIASAFICALGRYEPDFAHTRKATLNNRVIVAFKPLPVFSP